MRLARVVVKKLFGRFNYDIELRLKDRVTIIHGPNGYGKSTLLRLVRQALGAKTDQLQQMPCRLLSVYFDDGSGIEFERDLNAPAASRPLKQRLHVRVNGRETAVAPLPDSVRHRVAMLVEQMIPVVQRVGEDAWLNTRTGIHFDLQELLLHYRKKLPTDFIEWIEKEGGRPVPQLHSVVKRFRVFHIDTQRLTASHESDPEERQVETSPHRMAVRPVMPAVLSNAEKLKSIISSHVRDYGLKSTELDRTLPARILSGTPMNVSDEELRSRYKKVLALGKHVVEAGLLKEPFGTDFTYLHSLDGFRKQVLQTYLEDMEVKLSVFTEFAERVQLFTRIVNDLFLDKRIEVGPDYGFRFRTDTGQVLSADLLSSGEQHQVILLYDLLFRVRDNTLILVDEPEISLHVAWQQQVLKNFRSISKQRDLDFLIATHSPDIISNRWDLAIDLSEVNCDE